MKKPQPIKQVAEKVNATKTCPSGVIDYSNGFAISSLRICLLILCFIGSDDLSLTRIYAQSGSEVYPDSTNLIWKPLATPALLISGGLVINTESRKTSIQNLARRHFKSDIIPVDDILQHVPMAIVMLSGAVGMDASYGYKDQMKYLIISEALTLGITHLTKTWIPAIRPTGGGRSFPSGHTSYAFTAATVQYQIYKDTSPWLAWSSYIPATITGLYRVLRDKHWLSDVMVGAGLGILVPNLLIRWKGLSMKRHVKAGATYQFGIFPAGVVVVCTF